MITTKKLVRIKQNLVETRSRLLYTQPTFGLLLMHLRFVIDESVPTVSINEHCVFLNPNFIDRLYPRELDFTFCHLLMHVINGDIWRPIDWEGDNYHHACDIANNSALLLSNIGEERYPHLKKIHSTFGLHRKQGYDYSPKEIYAELLFDIEGMEPKDRRDYLFDSDVKWSDSFDKGQNKIILLESDDFYQTQEFHIPERLDNGNGKNGDGIFGERKKGEGDSKNGDGSSTENDNDNENGEGDFGEEIETTLTGADKWAAFITEALKSAKKYGGKGAGKLPGSDLRAIDKTYEAQTNWRKILNEFLSEETADYSFTPPDKRFVDFDFFLPDYNEKEYIAKDGLFMMDTSASISQEDLTLAYSEMQGAVAQFSEKLTGWLGFFDAEVQKVVPFSSVRDIVREKPVGGGGTSFHAIFDYVRNTYKNQLPAFVVIFTDGYADYPDQKDTMNIPVLWLINNTDSTPPWGKIARILSKKK